LIPQSLNKILYAVHSYKTFYKFNFYKKLLFDINVPRIQTLVTHKRETFYQETAIQKEDLELQEAMPQAPCGYLNIEVYFTI
jgi:hypothetical protein